MSLRHVKVTAHLISPLALSPDGNAPFLDAVCEWAMACRMRSIYESSNGRHGLDAARRRGQPVEKPGQIPIPIERRCVDGLPIPLCSAGIYAGIPERVEHFSRRFPTEMAALVAEEERTVLQATGGPFKSFRLPLRIVDAPQVVWFAALREAPTRLRALLNKHVAALGKKTSQGLGCVARWDVEVIECDFSWWASAADGTRLMRPLPSTVRIPDGACGFRKSFCGVCPPYWQRDLWREAVIPC